MLHGNRISYRADKRVDLANNLSLNFKKNMFQGRVGEHVPPPKPQKSANMTYLTRDYAHLSRKQDFGNYSIVSLTSFPRKIMEEIPLKIISKLMEEKKAIRKNKHKLTKGRQQLI